MADHKGKPPWNLLCDAQKGTTPAYRDGYERTFGKKPLPHGRNGRIECPSWWDRKLWDEIVGEKDLASLSEGELYHMKCEAWAKKHLNLKALDEEQA